MKDKKVNMLQSDKDFFINYTNYIMDNYPYVDAEASSYAEKKEMGIE
mgnify:FL=1